MPKRRIKKALQEFFQLEASSGIVLGVAAILAFFVANSSLVAGYEAALATKFMGLTIRYWINDGLMAIFFFLVGLEIKRELVLGHLNSLKKAALPLAAALGGMIVPALIYAYFNRAGAGASGWGIPMATDIAFAVGVLALFGKAVPLALKVFLLAVAIVDDLGAILVIAFFYTASIKAMGLVGAAAAFALILGLRFSGLRAYWIYVLPGAAVWLGFLYSGVHATIAGVLLGLAAPIAFPAARGSAEKFSPVDDLIHYLHPWVSFGIMPVFAFANAGIDLRDIAISEVVLNPINVGIVLGLFLGKPIGVFLSCALAVSCGLATLPQELRWGHVLSIGFLAGIGFTMSLFISGLALPTDLEIYSKTGIILGSIVSGICGSLMLRIFLNREVNH